MEVDSSYEYTKKACDESLKALQTDCIDLCKLLANLPFTYYALWSVLANFWGRGDYVHSVNPETPIEETMRGLKELQE